MNKEWVVQQEIEHEKAISEMREVIISKIKTSELFTHDEKAKMLGHLREMEESSYPFNKIDYDLTLAAVRRDDYMFDRIMEFQKDLEAEKYCGMLCAKEQYSRYLDSDPREFDGDIIITDPCYICKEDDESQRPEFKDFESADDYHKAYREWREANPRQWDVCEWGSNMEAFGITNYMTRGTLYGDWSCTTYNSDTKEKIGSFCADAGLVSVFLLDEVLRYNPEFDYHKNREWTTTWIPNFKGTVQFVVEREEGIYEDDTNWHKSGEKWVDYAVKVVGHGVNKLTGEPINFVTSQTGL